MTTQEQTHEPGPKLPTGFIVAVLLLIVSQVCILLLNQPAAYWVYPHLAANDQPLRFLLTGGPLAFAFGAAIYLLAAGFLLKSLDAHIAWPLAGGLFLLHSILLFVAMPCGLNPFEAHSRFGCNAPFYTANLVVAVFLLAALFGIRPSRWNRLLVWIAVPLVAAWLALLGVGFYRVIFPTESAWKLILPAHSPGPRTRAAIAYDTRRNRVVLFGGIAAWNSTDTIYDSSTWEWDGSDWHKIETIVVPMARHQHAMAYDESRGTVILYGGSNQHGALADLWEWDGVKWTQLCPVCNPAHRFSHRMFYDTVRENVIVYGGYNDKKGFGEAWMWSGDAWNSLYFSTNAPGFFNSPLVYDRQRQRAVGFVSSPDWSGTWIWEGDRWFQPKLDPQPSVRIEPAMVYDPRSGHIILFGGEHEDDGQWMGTYWLNDTWLFDGETWRQLQPPAAPPSRYQSTAFYDPVRQSIVIYGGEKDGRIYDDMWELILPGGN
jgi:hypothetical protein